MRLTDLWTYSGARWWKVDFHTHTPASADWDKAGDVAIRPSPEEWLLKFMQAGVDCVAITDHNSGAWIDRLKAANQLLGQSQPTGFRPLHLFPGVELSVNGGVHILAIFGAETSTSDIDTLLGKVDYQGTKGDSDGVTRKSLVEVVEAITSAGGVAIPAHVDEPKGLLALDGSGKSRAALDPNTLRQVFDSGRIIAMEVSDRGGARPEVYANAKCNWAELLGSDCHDFHGNRRPGTRFTWVKMSLPTIEGLRLALLDGDRFSLRRSDDPEAFDPFVLPKYIVEQVTVDNARYMGRGQCCDLGLSPWFNAIVGGRGTGKSTIVHALRLAYRRDSELSNLSADNEARRTFERFIREPQNRNDEFGALDYKASQKTTVQVVLRRDAVRHRLIWKQGDKKVTVEDELEGAWQISADQGVTADRFPIRIFSQGQIGSLAGDSQAALLALIDEAANTRPALDALEAAKREFFTTRAKIRELDAKLKDRGGLQTKLEDNRRKLSSFEGKQHADILKQYQVRTRQSREVDRQIEEVSKLASRLVAEADGIAIADSSATVFDAKDSTDNHAIAVISRLQESVSEAAAAIRRTGEQLQASADAERTSLGSSEWSVAVLEARTNYSRLTQELKQEGVEDPSEYGKLVQARQDLEAEGERLDGILREQDRLRSLSEQQVKSILSARQEISRQREAFLATALSKNLYVRIELLRYGRNERSIEAQFRKLLDVTDDRFADDILAFEDEEARGVVVDLIANVPTDATAAASEIEARLTALAQRLQRACQGVGDFGGHFNNFLSRRAAERPEQLDHILAWSPEDALRLEYSPKGDGKDFRPIGQASAGQRAAAMLAFLLAYGEEPLVLDQPEDDLDNHLIYELVVRQIREHKLRRQIIVITHNPNIVVNGDAEMLHALDFRAGQCRVVTMGSFQEAEMREEVCRVMEGGREAFERRYRRLGREVANA